MIVNGTDVGIEVEVLQEMRGTATAERNSRGTTAGVMLSSVDTLADAETGSSSAGGDADIDEFARPETVGAVAAGDIPVIV